MVAAKKVAPSGSIANKLALEKVVAKKLVKKIAASKPTVKKVVAKPTVKKEVAKPTIKKAVAKPTIKKAVAKKTSKKETMWRQPTSRQIACLHDFKPKPGFPINEWVCTKGCGGVQTQFASCNGNCRCGGEQ